jgi:hypothetical protein
MKHALIVLSTAALFALNSRTVAAPKPTLERGWIGGEYQTLKRGAVLPHTHAKVYVRQVYPGTPAAQAGLETGDLILSVDGREVAHLRHFRRLIDAAKPGSGAAISVMRAGQPFEVRLTIGRETYQRWHALSVGLHASARFDLLPNPDFSLLPLAKYKRPQERIELRSPEVRLAGMDRGARRQPDPGVRSEEGWDAWFLLFGLNSHKRILAQEPVPPATAMR